MSTETPKPEVTTTTTTPTTTPAPAVAAAAPLSKSAQKKLAQQQAKAARKTANAAKVAAATTQAPKSTTAAAELFGTYPLNQSQTREGAQYSKIKLLDATQVGNSFMLRGRVFANRGKGNLCFILLRQGQFSVQCVLAKDSGCPKEMIAFASKITHESIVDIVGVLRATPEPIEKASQKTVEIVVNKIFIVSSAAARLFFQNSYSTMCFRRFHFN